MPLCFPMLLIYVPLTYVSIPGGSLFLPEGGALPLCGSTIAQLSVALDPEDHVVETDEGNNRGTITGITVGGSVCNRKRNLTLLNFLDAECLFN